MFETGPPEVSWTRFFLWINLLYDRRLISSRFVKMFRYVGGPSLQRWGTRMDDRFVSPTAKARDHPIPRPLGPLVPCVAAKGRAVNVS